MARTISANKLPITKITEITNKIVPLNTYLEISTNRKIKVQLYLNSKQLKLTFL